MKPLTALIILDGFGYSKSVEGNAIREAGIPYICSLKANYPHTTIMASGLAVGLPDGQMGNSEVGHLNIGAGRVIKQELVRINDAVSDGSFYGSEAFIGAVDNCKRNNSALHLMGLCSDGGVHSHLNHLHALLELAKSNGLNKVYIHCFMDGRDVPPDSGIRFIGELQSKLTKLKCGRIATVMGRYYAMDRDNRYERVEKAYNAIVYGEGLHASSPREAVKASYDAGITDEFIVPVVIDGDCHAVIRPKDSVIFFNFRPDRARELTRALLFEEFEGFSRRESLLPLFFVSMTQYDKDFEGKLHVAFEPESIDNTFGEYISKAGLTQLRIAETEKYAHVTFFFNGGVEPPNPGEDRVLIPSPKVSTYDLAPAMSAYEVADEAVRRVKSGLYDVMILNFANPDMVGHTGVMAAAVDAVRTVDECVKRVVGSVLENGGSAIITADHGNSEMMKDTITGGPFTAHTTSPVPLILAAPAMKNASLRNGGSLCDIVPTMLEIMGLNQPVEMTGKSLIADKGNL